MVGLNGPDGFIFLFHSGFSSGRSVTACLIGISD
jgi:hypothetical protein